MSGCRGEDKVEVLDLVETDMEKVKGAFNMKGFRLETKHTSQSGGGGGTTQI